MYDLREFDFVKQSATPQTSDETLDILIYETAGDMNKLRHRARRYPVERNAYLGDLKIESADALSMLRMYYQQMSWDLYEMARLGEEHYLERMQDIRLLGLMDKLKKRSE